MRHGSFGSRARFRAYLGPKEPTFLGFLVLIGRIFGVKVGRDRVSLYGRFRMQFRLGGH